jgi:hypothetical protein
MFNDSHNKQLFQAAKEGRMVVFDYPYNPTPRDYNGKESSQKLRKILGKNDELYSDLIDEIERLKIDIGRIPAVGDPNGTEPYWANDWFSHLDAVSLYTLIRSKKPKVYLEIGSGTSTKFARRAISDGGLSTQIVSIDPHPRAEIDKICDVLDRRTLESLSEKDILKYVSDGDIVFLDCSHRSFQGSDVTVFFTEILPVLPVGLIYGIHDIFLPDDYPEEWRGRFYNEQYLLLSYLYGGCGGDEVIFPASYIGSHPTLSAKCKQLIEYWGYKDIVCGGGAFWLQRFREI